MPSVNRTNEECIDCLPVRIKPSARAGVAVIAAAEITLPKLCPTNTSDSGLPNDDVYFPALTSVASCCSIAVWMEAWATYPDTLFEMSGFVNDVHGLLGEGTNTDDFPTPSLS